MTAGPLPTLRRLRAARPDPEERCELCGEPVPARHRHLFEPTTRALLCTCQG
ncbi:MAG: DUF5947 family protein, partial [Candidatus Dormibacteraceae bacterium]